MSLCKAAFLGSETLLRSCISLGYPCYIASAVPREEVCVGGEYGQGGSQAYTGMGGAKTCGRLCRLSPPNVQMSVQVLRLTQQLGQGQPPLIAMFLHVARCVVHILRWRSCLEWRPRVCLLWQRTFEGQLLQGSSLSLLLWYVLHGSRQDLCHGSLHLRDTTGLRNPRLPTLLDKAQAETFAVTRMSQVSWSTLVRSGYATGTRGTAEEYCVRRAGIHMRAVAGIIGNGFRKPRNIFLRLEHF